MTLPTGMRGRLVALGLVLIPLLLLLRFAAWPLIDRLSSAEEERAAKRAAIAHYQRLLAQAPGLEAAVSRLERTRPLASYLFAGGNRALAAAGLQRTLQASAKKNGATVLSLRVMEPVADGPLERIPVEARLLAGIGEARNLLYEIETATPYLFIDTIDIDVRRSRRRQTAAAEPLSIRLVVYGLRASDGPAPDGSANG